MNDGYTTLTGSEKKIESIKRNLRFHGIGNNFQVIKGLSPNFAFDIKQVPVN